MLHHWHPVKAACLADPLCLVPRLCNLQTELPIRRMVDVSDQFCARVGAGFERAGQAAQGAAAGGLSCNIMNRCQQQLSITSPDGKVQ